MEDRKLLDSWIDQQSHVGNAAGINFGTGFVYCIQQLHKLHRIKLFADDTLVSVADNEIESNPKN